jgi:L-ascorbate metabolism protein UlaG (beta-lactamase superfamily)
MKKIRLFLALILICAACNGHASQSQQPQQDSNMETFIKQGYAVDTLTTPKNRLVKIAFIKHASIAFEIDGKLIYIDPTTAFGNDFSLLPKADYIMVTHEHHDHYDPAALSQLRKDGTQFVANGRVTQMEGKGKTVTPGDSIAFEALGIRVKGTAAYNITPSHLQYHPKARLDVGFLFDIDGLKIYVAGDTEDIPEMQQLGRVDVAFVPVNQPYTMTPQQAVHAIEMIHPRIVYPYHFGETNLTPLTTHFTAPDSVEIRLREMQ